MDCVEKDNKDDDQPGTSQSYNHRCVGNLLQYIKAERDKFYEEPSREKKEVTIFSSYRKTEKPTSQSNVNYLSGFYCNICSVDCTSQSGLDSHLNGKRHLKNLKKREEHSVLPRKKVDKLIYRDTCEACIQRELEEYAMTEPLVGVEYITEYINPAIPDQQRYSCDLCDARGSREMIICHVAGRQHRKTFMKVHHSELYEKLILYPSRQKNLKASEFSTRLRKMSIDVLARSSNKIGQCKVAEKPDVHSESFGNGFYGPQLEAVKEVKESLEKKEEDLMKKELELARREAELEKVRRNMIHDVRNSTASSKTIEEDSDEFMHTNPRSSNCKRKLNQELITHEYKNMFLAKKRHRNDHIPFHHVYDHNLATNDNVDDCRTNQQSVLLRNPHIRNRQSNNADASVSSRRAMRKTSTTSNRIYSSVGSGKASSSSKHDFVIKLEEQELRIESALYKLQQSIGQSKMTAEETDAKKKLTKILLNVRAQKEKAMIIAKQTNTPASRFESQHLENDRDSSKNYFALTDTQTNTPASRFESQHLENDRDSSKKYFASTDTPSRVRINPCMQPESAEYSLNALKGSNTMSQAEPSQTVEEVRKLIEETRRKVEKKILLELNKGSLAGLAKVFENNTDLQAALKKWEEHGKEKKVSNLSTLSSATSCGVSVQIQNTTSNRRDVRTVSLSHTPINDDIVHTDGRYYNDVSSVSLQNRSTSAVLKQFPRAHTGIWKQRQQQYPDDETAEQFQTQLSPDYEAAEQFQTQLSPDDEAAEQFQTQLSPDVHRGRQGTGLLGDKPGLLGTRPQGVTYGRR